MFGVASVADASQDRMQSPIWYKTAKSRADAVRMGRIVNSQLKLFTNVSDSQKELEDDPHTLYRIRCSSEQIIEKPIPALRRSLVAHASWICI